ncbi:GTP pyrophosphokinase [Paenibacillus xylaniclasticus]|uniref:GTP pyrophosphokinase n=1 Tax=Paenibacillus xylaniclasticus TaxID=588083 RepID=UPI00175740A1|nr:MULTISPECIES: GTP pyrophosphokinase [Paenibacillus]GFN32504.1 hypothetical protein PCURB6_27640 [Paenibacillus curdlanolyticus]
MATLEKAIKIAVLMHEGQTDKSGRPYILHPLRLMHKATISEDQRIVAVLHDIVENTSYTLNDLKFDGFSDDIISAIDHLTKRENEAYEDYIDRLGQNELAKQVKFLEINDNLRGSSLNSVIDLNSNHIQEYRMAAQRLLG